MARRRRGQPVHGWVVLDKPAGMTSTQAVGAVRRLLDAAKAGHAGTLDPLATGILPVALGEATKTVPYAMDREKLYRFTIRWGEARATEDAEGEVTATSAVRPARAEVETVLPRFVGTILQQPPAYSALKIDGARAYDLARQGEAVMPEPRLIEIHALRLIDMPDADYATFEAESGSGAYMRSLARDIALALGTVGHVSALRRLAVGAFTLDEATTLSHLERLAEEGDASRALLPVETPLDDIPAVALTQSEAHQMRCGQAVALLRRSDLDRLSGLREGTAEGDGTVLAFHGDVPVALARVEGAELRPIRVLNL